MRNLITLSCTEIPSSLTIKTFMSREGRSRSKTYQIISIQICIRSESSVKFRGSGSTIQFTTLQAGLQSERKGRMGAYLAWVAGTLDTPEGAGGLVLQRGGRGGWGLTLHEWLGHLTLLKGQEASCCRISGGWDSCIHPLSWKKKQDWRSSHGPKWFQKAAHA